MSCVVATLALSGCVSQTFSRSEADHFVNRLLEFEEIRRDVEKQKEFEKEKEQPDFPERSLEHLLQENQGGGCCEEEFSFDESPGKRFSSWAVEDFLYSDSRILHLGARRGRYPFYKDGMVIWKHHTIPVLHHELPWNLSLRVVTPLNVSEVDRAGGASQWGVVLRKKF
ncbi:MAG: hypothetical protein RJA61_541 [Candidatus Parcubacteria bacterium]